MSNCLASQEGFNIQLKKFRTCLNSFWTSFFKCYQTKIDAKCDQKHFQKKARNLIFLLEKWEYSNKIFPFYFNFLILTKFCNQKKALLSPLFPQCAMESPRWNSK
jgi:hypothetical protein